MVETVKILIAEDEADDRLSLRDLLESQGYTVAEAADTVSAVSQALEQVPDLIILDVGMPPEDGYAVCRRLRSDARTQQVPILMLTCHAYDHDKVTGLDSGADYYITKPCDNDVLLSAIRALFRRYPPRPMFFERILRAHLSIEAAEEFRSYVVVLSIDVKGSSAPVGSIPEEYLRALVFNDYRSIVEAAVDASGGSPVAWSGDGGTSEFPDASGATSAGLSILRNLADDHNLSKLIVRIGIAGGTELLEPSSTIGKRTSQTHNRAGHFQKYSNDNRLTVGKEIFDELPDKSLFRVRAVIGGEATYESQ